MRLVGGFDSRRAGAERAPRQEPEHGRVRVPEVQRPRAPETRRLLALPRRAGPRPRRLRAPGARLPPLPGPDSGTRAPAFSPTGTTSTPRTTRSRTSSRRRSWTASSPRRSASTGVAPTSTPTSIRAPSSSSSSTTSTPTSRGYARRSRPTSGRGGCPTFARRTPHPRGLRVLRDSRAGDRPGPQGTALEHRHHGPRPRRRMDRGPPLRWLR